MSKHLGKDPLIFGSIDARRFRPRLLETRPCNRCGAMIHLMRTATDARMPVDVLPVKITRQDEEEGLPVRLFSSAGKVRDHFAGEVGFVPHWVSCPHAEDFRNRGRAKRPAERLSPAAFRKRLAYVDETLKRLLRKGKKQDRETIILILKALHTHYKHTLKIFDQNQTETESE